MRSICIQLATVYGLVAFCSYVTIVMDFNSYLNLLWLVGFPLGTAVAANWNKPPELATGMAVGLLVCSFLGFGTAVAIMGA